ncbi:hypothetical protein D3C71_2180660 [compost metagenome]
MLPPMSIDSTGKSSAPSNAFSSMCRRSLGIRPTRFTPNTPAMASNFGRRAWNCRLIRFGQCR